jgi:hypothetical protein
VAAVLFQDFRVDGAVSGGAGGVRGVLQFQQRVDCLPRPDHVICGAGLGDGGQLPKQMKHCTERARLRRRRASRRRGRRSWRTRQCPGGVHALGAAQRLHGDQREFPEDGEWTQASSLATRNPVSSKCATLARTRALTKASRNGAIISAIFLVILASATGDGAQPNISAIVRQARSLDKNCPATGTRPAPRPVLHRGGHPLRQWPQVTVPQLHRWPIIWRSVISAFTSGISVTCRRMTLASAAPARSRSHPTQQDGSCRITDRDDHSAASSRPAALPAGPASGRSSSAATSGPPCPARPATAAARSSSIFCLSLAARSATCA